MPRVLVATFAFICAWLLTAVFDALHAPGWTIVAGSAVVVASIAAVIFSVHLWTQADERDEERRSDHGGGGPRRKPDAPQRGGDGKIPSWWPEFERQLAFYVAERNRVNATATLPRAAALTAGREHTLPASFGDPWRRYHRMTRLSRSHRDSCKI